MEMPQIPYRGPPSVSESSGPFVLPPGSLPVPVPSYSSYHPPMDGAGGASSSHESVNPSMMLQDNNNQNNKSSSNNNQNNNSNDNNTRMPPVSEFEVPPPGAATVISTLDARTLQQQLDALTIDERRCVTSLQSKWESRANRAPFPPEWYLRFAQCSPGAPFTMSTAWKVMKKFEKRYLSLSITTMERQLVTQTIFIPRGLKSLDGHAMFYFRPSRFFPREMASSTIIDNLAYIMQCMLENEQSLRDGIGLVANMTHWKMVNFSIAYWHKFMMTLQGRRGPTRVQLFLIVNPPSWFGSIWAIMRPMMSDAFRRKIHIIPAEELPNYLAAGFEDSLPDDMMPYGKGSTEHLLRDFVAERKRIESNRILTS